jgi:hypothetical protein
LHPKQSSKDTPTSKNRPTKASREMTALPGNQEGLFRYPFQNCQDSLAKVANGKLINIPLKIVPEIIFKTHSAEFS